MNAYVRKGFSGPTVTPGVWFVFSVFMSRGVDTLQHSWKLNEIRRIHYLRVYKWQVSSVTPIKPALLSPDTDAPVWEVQSCKT